jgi:hypothetical protein
MKVLNNFKELQLYFIAGKNVKCSDRLHPDLPVLCNV